MVDFIYSLMTDKRKGALFVPFKVILYALSLVYGLAIWIRSLLYRFRIFKATRVPIKIISVGNLTLGGTGKTPFVIALVNLFKEAFDKVPAVLIRGYGWDEQALLKKRLSDAPILVGENRCASAHRAIRLYGSDTAILDDGFQHWEIERDLNIVLVDSRNPFGNNRIFPRGVLREPRAAIRRADIVVFTKTDKKRIDIEGMKRDLKTIKDGLIFLEASHRPRYFYNENQRKELALPFIDKRRVILLSSIGDPAYFEETVRGLGAEVLEHIAFADHHNYRAADMERIMKTLNERSFDCVVTTEKDMVKLRRMHLSFGQYTVLTLAVEMEITAGKERLFDRLNSLYSR